MITHTLKSDPSSFKEVYDGKRHFEIRYNDRGYGVGDELILRETRFSAIDMADGSPLEFTGKEIMAHVTSIMHGPIYGLNKGWCIMSIQVYGTVHYPDLEVDPS